MHFLNFMHQIHLVHIMHVQGKEFTEIQYGINIIVGDKKNFFLKEKITNNFVEPIYCKKQQKRSWPVTGLWNRGPLKILNGMKLILDDQGHHLDSYTISLESFRSFKGPLFCKPVTVQEIFLLFLTANWL